jgi:triacylglycerol esterase/lipase EstA (alpha/beta hydrolase family)
MILLIPGMMFTGGDMISLGSLVNRLQWLFLGILAFDVSIKPIIDKSPSF